MKHFFQSFFASLLAFIVAGIILIFIFIAALIGSMAGSSASFLSGNANKVKLKDNSVLQIKFEDEIVDRTKDNPFEGFDFRNIGLSGRLGLNHILKAIHRAKDDEKIKGICLNLTEIQTGMATMEEIRNALIDFKKSGKWIISYSEVYSQATYYLASVSDDIYIYPEGNLDFKGFRAEIAFMKGALDKLEIEAQIIRGRNNKFKSAVEPLMYDHMSDANRAQMEKYVGSLWDHYVAKVSEARGISVEDLNKIADSLYVREAKDAVTYRLADHVAYKDVILDTLRNKLGLEKGEKINFVEFTKYMRKKKFDKDKLLEKNKIAVIYASGSIQSGENEQEAMGSETISEAIRDARTDTTVKAIVFRVNSPGGSALASDVMWREVVLAKNTKPVVVSMGDVAASGGYYISCASTKIYANPNTITGSIGVFGVLPNTQKFFNNKLGITFDGIKTNHYSDFADFTRPLTHDEFNIIQQGVDQIYDLFLSHVADGRKMAKADVDSIGQGRVWSGADAKELGLIDEFGGLEDAIAGAAKLAGLENYKIKELPKEKNPFEEIFGVLMDEAKVSFLKSELGSRYTWYAQVRQATKLNGMQALMPYSIRIY